MLDAAGGGAISLVRDTVNPHSGSATLQVISANTANGAGAASACITGVSSGVASASFWYRTTDANATGINYTPEYFSTTNCTGGILSSSSSSASPLTRDGQWHQVSNAAVTVPAGSQSAMIFLFITCTTCTSLTANFDDVVFDQPQLAVTLVAFTAARGQAGVPLRWRAASETEVVGFHVYRERGGTWKRVDRRLIAAKGSAAGARYSFIDRGAAHGMLRYRLQAVGEDGSRTWYGQACVAR